MTEGWGGTVPESYDSGSYGSPEGVQTTVATVPKHIADGLAEALEELAAMDFGVNVDERVYDYVCRKARSIAKEYRKATQ
jgi:hypothetical protein